MIWEDKQVRVLFVHRLCAVPFLRLRIYGVVIKYGQVQQLGLLHLAISGGLLGNGRCPCRALRFRLILWYWYLSWTRALTNICFKDLLVLNATLGFGGKILERLGRLWTRSQCFCIILRICTGGRYGVYVVQNVSLGPVSCNSATPKYFRCCANS